MSCHDAAVDLSDVNDASAVALTVAGDYRANHCHETSHCIPCWVRYATCQGQQDGLNPWPELEWRPFFVECYRERTVFQGNPRLHSSRPATRVSLLSSGVTQVSNFSNQIVHATSFSGHVAQASPFEVAER